MEFIKYIKWSLILFFIFHFYFQYKNYIFLKKIFFEFEKNDFEIKKIEKNLESKKDKINENICLKIQNKLNDFKKINNLNSDYLNLLNWINNSLNLFNFNENIEKKIDENIFLESLLETHKNQKFEILKNKNTNLCLNGPSGVGKNIILDDLAKSLSIPIEKITYSEINNDFLYGNKNEMSIFSKFIIKHQRNDLIIVFDEIDKMGENSNIFLELFNINLNEEARKIKDNYFDFEIDLSNIWFICTSNKIENLSTALKSRLKIIEFFNFSKEEKFNLIKNYLFIKIVKNLKKNEKFSKTIFTIDDEFINYLIEKNNDKEGIREIYIELKSIVNFFIKNNNNFENFNLTMDEIKIFDTKK